MKQEQEKFSNEGTRSRAARGKLVEGNQHVRGMIGMNGEEA